MNEALLLFTCYACTRPALACPDLVTFTAADIGFLFDHSTNSERASRTVAA